MVEADKKNKTTKAKKKKVLKFLPALIPLSVVLAIVIYNLTIVIMNNIQCSKRQKEFEKTVSGLGYEIIAKDNQCGRFNYNSNGLTYLNCVVIKTDDEWFEIQSSFEYSGVVAVAVSSPKLITSEVQSSIEFDELSDIESFDGYYYIYKTSLPSSVWLYDSDFRGQG